MSHVGSPSGGQVRGQEPEPDGVRSVGPRSMNEGQPGESCCTKQEAPKEHLYQRLGVIAEATARFETARMRCRHDHAYEATGPGV